MVYILAWFIYILCVFGALGVLRESNLQKDSIIVDVLCPVADINFGTTRSVLFCAEHCSSNSVCTSVFYHKTTKECYGATTTIYSASGCESRLGMMYFKQEIGEYGKSCLSDADCPSMYTECSAGVCNCVAGAPYDHSSGQCLYNCTNYGHLYTEYAGMALSTTSIDTVDGVTKQDCENICSLLPDCRGFNYSSSRSKCRPMAKTPLTDPGSYVPLSSVNHNTRNCA